MAYSSRNKFLSKRNLQKAIKISKILMNFYNCIKINFSKIDDLRYIKKKISQLSSNVEYLEVRNKKNLSKHINKRNFKIFVSYYINNIRLIDNF